ncbi:MAG: hypothetical protein IPO19_00270 [Rhodoferax sp.]|nr:hypothetical protein [Rhodoferax sp.]
MSPLFNVRLPFNFNSPYQARETSQTSGAAYFVSLSTFLRDYLYIPLGGNRGGPVRRYLNLATTMVLGGLWHGASWSFVVWGALHGAYLMINHGFRAVLGERAPHRWEASPIYGGASWALTLGAVVVGLGFLPRRDPVAARCKSSMPCSVGRARPTRHQLIFGTKACICKRGPSGLALGLAALFAPSSNRIVRWLSDRFVQPTALRSAATGAALTLVAMLLVVNVTRSTVRRVHLPQFLMPGRLLSVLFGMAGALLACELVLQALPVSSATARDYYMDPQVLSYPPGHRWHGDGMGSASNAQTLRANNFGFASEIDFVPDPQAVAFIGDSYVEASMLGAADRPGAQLARAAQG